MKYLLGIDIGGTTVKIGLVSYAGVVIEKFEIPTNTANNGASILGDIKDAIYTFLAENNIDRNSVTGIGFGVPGPVVNNVINKCTNLGWGIVDIVKEFGSLLDWNPVIACTNDANAAALGEMHHCNDSSISSSVLMTLGTGVGGGIIINNNVINGAHGGAGEFGHMKIDTVHKYKCNCGGCGCLETVASATGVVRLAKEYLGSIKSSLDELAIITAKDVFDAAKAGDELALKVVKEVGEYIGLAAAHISTVVDPDIFIIGGGVSKAGNILIDVVKDSFRTHAFHVSKNIPFTLATLGNDAGMVGAALLAKL